ncbi:MAG: SRPBCC family protein [Prevotella sp.]|nr:SRPBCC family protein [Prevotella sp.]
MAKYESKIKHINAPVESVYATLSNLENLRPMLENARNSEVVKEKIREAGQDPAQLEKLDEVTLTPDRISFPAPMVGEVALAVVEREENKCIKFQTEQSPVEANLWIQVLPVTDTTSKMRLTLKADLNPMIKMMIGSKLEKGLDQFADMLAMIPY